MGRRIRSLAVSALVVVALLVVPSLASADHFRGGYVTWKRPTGSGNTVEFESIQVWRGGAVTPLQINPGVGDITYIGPVSTIFTGVDLAGDSYTMISYKVTYTYPSTGVYTAFLGIGTHDTTCCRIVDILNASDQPQRVISVVDLTGGNTGSPVPAIPMLLQLTPDCTNSVPLLASDPNGFTCRLADQFGDNTGAPGMFPIVAPAPPNDVLSITGCTLSWQTDGTVNGDKYAAQIILEDAGPDATKIAVDLLIEIKDGPCCGNNIVGPDEECDGTADAACPGGCKANCLCGSVCGNNITEPGEVCDGTEDSACPGACQPPGAANGNECTCCGDNIIQANEGCDGTNDAACPGGCQGYCSCCGDGVAQSFEECDGVDDAACDGRGCSFALCVCHGTPSCTDHCTDDVSVCTGTSGSFVVDVGQAFSTPFLGSDPCDALIDNDATWGTLPPGATLSPPAGTVDPAPTTGTCSHDNSISCTTCDDCNGICSHDSHVSCSLDVDCSTLSPGSRCVFNSVCNKPPNQFPATFNWTPTSGDAAQTWGVTVTFTPPGFTVPGGTQYFCDFQIRVPGCGDDVVDRRCTHDPSVLCNTNADCNALSPGSTCTAGEKCDGAANAACGGNACLPPGHPHECQCPVCGDDEINLQDEVCDGSDDSACPGLCHPPGGANECTCPSCGDGEINGTEQCDGGADAACPGRCLPTCVCAVCGDGIVHPGIGERCEPPPGNDSACPGNCLPPGDPNECLCRGCGDGDVNQPSEQCDGADAAACPGLCLPTCLCPTCGDGAVNQPSEQCDGAAAAACPGQCLPPGDPNQCKCPGCGDGDVNRPGEQCDGADAAACPGLCLPSCLCPLCGDGSVNQPGEQCDGADSVACVGECRPPGDPNQCKCPVCGDGDLNRPSEECDLSDDAACPGQCLPTCLCPACGDGVLSPPAEQCEAGHDAACPGLCRPPNDQNECRCPVCGDDDVNQGSEQCDGTDATACPGRCAADCTCAVCGDGTISPPVEDCDGALDVACPGDCAPPGDPNACHCPRCGDGVVNQPTEECDGPATGMCSTGTCQPDCTYATCGNCNLDTGEQCDPPNREICNNLIDDDGDGKLNCTDTDCTPGRTCKHQDPVVNALLSSLPCAGAVDCNGRCSHNLAITCTTDAQCSALQAGSFCVAGAKCICPDTPGGFQTCGANCAPVFGCRCIDNDPARIRFGKTPADPSLLKIHGRFRFDSPMDPPSDGFTLLISNASGQIVYRGTLEPGDLTGSKGRYKFIDPAAKHGAGTRDGLYRVAIKLKKVHGVINYVFQLQAYGDFSTASTLMTTQIIAGDDTASLSGQWTQINKGWKLTDFE